MKITLTTTLFLAASSGLALPALAGDLPWYKKIRMDEVRTNTGLTGNGIRIGQTESGVPLQTHVALEGQVAAVRAFGTVTDHGTHTGSILVGKKTEAGGDFRGVAPGAKLYSGWTSRSNNAATQTQRFKDSADWHLARGVNLVNVSWGRDWFEPVAMREGITRVADLMTFRHDVLYVTAAGNEGDEVGTAGGGFGTITNPGYAYNSLTVGATSRASGYQRLVDFSSRAAPNARVKPDLVAPGGRILGAAATSNTTFRESSGTSYATPMVAGTVALLQEHGLSKGFSTNPLVMRSVVMNSTNKSVEDLGGVRWDRNPNLGRGAFSMSNQTGTGQLDAMQAYLQYDAGRYAPTYVGDTLVGASVPLVGWDTGFMLGATGVGNSSDYLTEKPLRKGSYLTSTLTWNRSVNTRPGGGTTDESPDKWVYNALNNFDLGVSELGSVGTIRQKSDSNDSTAEHLLYKVQNAKQHYIRAWAQARPDDGFFASQYGLAWNSWAAPTEVRSFNGDFKGDRLSLLDNGWFDSSGIGGSSDVTDPAFRPIGPNRWAMTLSPTVALLGRAAMSQEMVTPSNGLSLSFDIGFDYDFSGSVWVELAGMNLLDLAGLGVSITPVTGDNVERYQRITLNLGADHFAALGGDFQDLRFVASSAFGSFGNAYIDNVRYVPTPGTMALGLGSIVGLARRRRV
ncbi:MAG: S8 family serine peptidase [Phycisphaeraceae bacterium]|nr:S8 family serine peptidase [Phycisphaeraceae bacterium]